MIELTVEAAAADLPRLIEAALRGDCVYITDQQGRRVRLVAETVSRGPRRAGSARGQVTMAPDFDAPLDESSGATLLQARGLLASDTTPPDDSAVGQWLSERREERFGS